MKIKLKNLLIFITLFFTNSLFSSDIENFQQDLQIFENYHIRLLKESDLLNFRKYIKGISELDQSDQLYRASFLDDLTEDEKIEDIQENLKLKNFYSQFFQENDPENEIYMILNNDKIVGHIDLSVLMQLTTSMNGVDIVFPLNKLKTDLSCHLLNDKESRLLNICFFLNLERLEDSNSKIIFSNIMKTFVQQKIIPRLMKDFHEFSTIEEAHKIFLLIMKDEITAEDQYLKAIDTKSFQYVGVFTKEGATSQMSNLLQEIGFIPYAIPAIDNTQLFYITNHE